MSAGFLPHARNPARVPACTRKRPPKPRCERFGVRRPRLPVISNPGYKVGTLSGRGLWFIRMTARLRLDRNRVLYGMAYDAICRELRGVSTARRIGAHPSCRGPVNVR